MVGIVSGNGVGLNLSTLSNVGQRGNFGSAQQGKTGEQSYVNIANGNLIVQAKDNFIASIGDDLSLFRTYNSQGTLKDDNADNWWMSGYRRLTGLTSTINSVGSTITKVDKDGSKLVYTYDASSKRYIPPSESGHYDSISNNGSSWIWTSVDQTKFETYDVVLSGSSGSGWGLKLESDNNGNSTTYSYLNNLLSSVTSSSNERIEFTYTGKNLTSELVRDSSGKISHLIQYTYDQQNRLTQIRTDLTPEDGNINDGKVYVTTYSYNNANLITSITQTDGSQRVFTYDTQNRVTSVADEMGRITKFEYDQANRKTTVTDALGNKNIYTYDAQNRFINITGPTVNGIAQNFSYTYQNGNLHTVTDANGVVTTNNYDAIGNLLSKVDSLGSHIEFAYTNSSDLSIRKEFVENGKVLIQRYVYDNNHHVRFAISANGDVTEYRYDAKGLRTQTINYATPSFDLSPWGNEALSLTTMEGWSSMYPTKTTIKEFEYDFRGQLSKTWEYLTLNADATGNKETAIKTTFIYDSNGNLLQAIDNRQGSTTYTYDGLNRLLSVIDAKQQLTLTQYDDANNLVKQTFSGGRVETKVYDKSGALITSLSAGIAKTEFRYNLLGQLIYTVDPTGIKHYYVYDAAGNLQADIDSNGGATEYSYDAAGNKTKTTSYSNKVDLKQVLAFLNYDSFVGNDIPTSPSAQAWNKSTTYKAGDLVIYGQKVYRANYSLSNSIPGETNNAQLWSEISQNNKTRTWDKYQLYAKGDAVLYAGKIYISQFDNLLGVEPEQQQGWIIQVPTGSGSSATGGYISTPYSATTPYQTGAIVSYSVEPFGVIYWQSRIDNLSGAIPGSSPNWKQLPQKGLNYVPFIRSVAYMKGDTVSYNGKLWISNFDWLSQSVPGNNAQHWTEQGLAPVLPPAPKIQDFFQQDLAKDIVTTNVYVNGRLSKSSLSNSTTTTFEYDISGNLVETSQQSLKTGEIRKTINFYDATQKLIGSVDAEGNITEYRYDHMGRKTSIVQYATKSTNASKASNFQQLISKDGAKDAYTYYFYDSASRLVGNLNAERYLTEFAYDKNGNLKGTIQYSVAVQGSISDITTLNDIRPQQDGRSLISSNEYDELNRLILSTSISGTKTQFIYDAAGNLASRIDGLGTAEARQSTQKYDALGRVIQTLSGIGSSKLVAANTPAEIAAIWTDYGTSVNYDNASRKISSTTNGHTTLYFYDQSGHLTHTVNAIGEVEEQTFNALGQLTSKTRYAKPIQDITSLKGGLVTEDFKQKIALIANTRFDSTETYTYNYAGQLETITDAVSKNVTRITYNFGQRDSVISPLNDKIEVKTEYRYNKLGQLTDTIEDANGLGRTVHTDYDAFGRAYQIKDGNGNVQKRYFDRLGRTVEVTDVASQHGITTTYDAFDRVLTQTDANKGTTTYSYNIAERTSTITSPEGVSVIRQNNQFGEVLRVLDGNRNTTTYTYDLDGNLEKVTSPLSQAANANLSVRGNTGLINTSYDANGNKTTFTYDALNRILTRTQEIANGEPITTKYTYGVDDADGTYIDTEANKVVTRSIYDAKGQLVKQILDPTGLRYITEYQYDDQGHTLKVVHRSDKNTNTAAIVTALVTEYVYDHLGRRTDEFSGNIVWVDLVTTSGGHGKIPHENLKFVRHYEYDANNNVISTRDAGNFITRFAYDSENREIARIDAAGGMSRTEYDNNGHIVKVTRFATAANISNISERPTATELLSATPTQSTKDQVTRNFFDKDGRVKATVNSLGTVIGFSYDANGNVTKKTTYATPVDVNTLGAESPNPGSGNKNNRVEYFGYDAANRLKVAVNAVGAITQYEYDSVGNLVSKADVYEITNDPEGVTKSVWPRGINPVKDRVSYFAYDAASRLIYTVDSLGHVTENKYADKVVTQTKYENSVAISSFSSKDIEQALLTIKNPAKDRTTTTRYDNAGHVIALTDALGFTETYEYNELGQKSSFTNKEGNVWTYKYDSRGFLSEEISPAVKVTDTSLSAGNWDVKTAVAKLTTIFGYDTRGNLTSRTEARYTIVNLTSGIEVLDTTKSKVTLYEYDALNRQTKTTYAPVDVFTFNGNVSAKPEPQTLTTNVAYDALGNAISNKDVGGIFSYKVYDKSGQVRFDIDGSGYITEYKRNSFGETETLIRYANAKWIQPRSPSTEEIENTISANSSTDDRKLITTYDQLGRVKEVVNPTTYIYDSTSKSGYDASKIITNTYDSFGSLVRVATTQNNVVTAYTTNYFDKAGQQIASVDAEGYLTKFAFDANGNLIQRIEFYERIKVNSSTGSLDWKNGIPDVKEDPSKDRKLSYTYDKLNRKVAETTYNLSTNGTNQLVASTTYRTYDKLGNETSVAEIETVTGQRRISYKHYDALGRVISTISPTSGSANGTQVLMTEFKRDALGNEVQTIQREIKSGADYYLIASDNKKYVYSAELGFFLEKEEATDNLPMYRLEVSWLKDGYIYTTNRAEFDELAAQPGVGHLERIGYIKKSPQPGMVGIRRFYSEGEQRRLYSSDTNLGPDWKDEAIPITEPMGYAFKDIDIATGSYKITGTDYTSPSARVTTKIADINGHVTAIKDAEGNVTSIAYDAYGRIAKQSAEVIVNRRDKTLPPEKQTSYSVFQYDGSGHLVSTITPGTVTFNTEKKAVQGADVVSKVNYNAFGEVTSQSIDNIVIASYSYDNAGNVWLSNAANGSEQVYLHDAMGNVTAQIAVSDKKTVAGKLSSATAGAIVGMRSETHYNRLGQILEQIAPEQTKVAHLPLKSSEMPFYLDVSLEPIPHSGGGGRDEIREQSNGNPDDNNFNNSISISFDNQPEWGSGNLKVAYKNVSTGNVETDYLDFEAGIISSHKSYRANAGNIDVDIYKKDVSGTWVLLKSLSHVTDNYLPAPLEALYFSVPASIKDTVTLEFSSNSLDWDKQKLVNFGDGFVLLNPQFPGQTLQYRISIQKEGASDNTTYYETGVVKFTNDKAVVLESRNANGEVITAASTQNGDRVIQAITTPISVGNYGNNVLSWKVPLGYSQSFNYRVAGTSGGWKSANISVLQTTAASKDVGVDLKKIGNGNYEFELVWSDSQGVVAKANGTIAVDVGDELNSIPKVTVPVTFDMPQKTKLSWVQSDSSKHDRLLYRLEGSNATWSEATISHPGSGLSNVDTTKFAKGLYEFDLQLLDQNNQVTGHETGTLNIDIGEKDLPPVREIPTGFFYSASNYGYVQWGRPIDSIQQKFFYKASNTAGDPNIPLPVTALNADHSGVNINGLASGNYAFEVQWFDATGNMIAHTIGNFNKADFPSKPLSMLGVVIEKNDATSEVEKRKLSWSPAAPNSVAKYTLWPKEGTPSFISQYMDMPVSIVNGNYQIDLSSFPQGEYTIEITETVPGDPSNNRRSVCNLKMAYSGAYVYITNDVQVSMSIDHSAVVANNYIIGGAYTYDQSVIQGHDADGRPIYGQYSESNGQVINWPMISDYAGNHVIPAGKTYVPGLDLSIYSQPVSNGRGMFRVWGTLPNGSVRDYYSSVRTEAESMLTQMRAEGISADISLIGYVKNGPVSGWQNDVDLTPIVQLERQPGEYVYLTEANTVLQYLNRGALNNGDGTSYSWKFKAIQGYMNTSSTFMYNDHVMEPMTTYVGDLNANLLTTPAPGYTPVHRVAAKLNGNDSYGYYYVRSEFGLQQILKNIWGPALDLGIVGYAADTQLPGTVPLYRLQRDANFNDFKFVTSETERDYWLQNGWSYHHGDANWSEAEAIVGYVPTQTQSAHIFKPGYSESNGVIRATPNIEWISQVVKQEQGQSGLTFQMSIGGEVNNQQITVTRGFVPTTPRHISWNNNVVSTNFADVLPLPETQLPVVFVGDLNAYLLKDPAPGFKPVYRFDRTISPERFLYIRSEEGRALLNQQVFQEAKELGIAGYIAETQLPGTVPLYRLQWPSSNGFKYTTDESEKNSLLASGWVMHTGDQPNGTSEFRRTGEPIVGYVLVTPKHAATYTVTVKNDNVTDKFVYVADLQANLLTNSKAGYKAIHKILRPDANNQIHYTSSEEAYQLLLQGTWGNAVDLGIVGYIADKQEPGTMPLYKLIAKASNDFRYVTSITERDFLLANGWEMHHGDLLDGPSQFRREGEPIMGYASIVNDKVSYDKAESAHSSQTHDRWGNTLTLTDWRNVNWITTYTYNNQNLKTSESHTDGKQTTISFQNFDSFGRLTSSIDARGFKTGYEYDAVGNLLHKKSYEKNVNSTDPQASARVLSDTTVYDAFGNKITYFDNTNRITKYGYDRLGQLTSVTTEEIIYTTPDPNVDPNRERMVGAVPHRDSYQTRYEYDALGRRVKSTITVAASTDGASVYTDYDLRGNVIAVDNQNYEEGVVDRKYDDPNVYRTYTQYDAQGHKLQEFNADGRTQSWTYQDGKLRTHINLGGQTSTMEYNDLGLLKHEYSGDGKKDIFYSYDTNSRLIYIDDKGTNTATRYQYDAVGNRIFEKIIQTSTQGKSSVLQSNYLAYDWMGRLALVEDGYFRLAYTYDENGNRTIVESSYNTPSSDKTTEKQGKTTYNSYDFMNRQIIVDGALVNGVAAIDAGHGHQISYDDAGRRLTDTSFGTRVLTQVTSNSRITTTENNALVVVTYEYNKAGMLENTYRQDKYILNGVEDKGLGYRTIDRRFFDRYGQVVRSGIGGELAFELLFDPALAKAFADAKVNTDVHWSVFESRAVAQLTFQQTHQDNGSYSVARFHYYQNGNMAYYNQDSQTRVDYTYKVGDDYQIETVNRFYKNALNGTTTNTFDNNGHLVGSRDSNNNSNAATLSVDTAGHLLKKTQGNNTSRNLMVNDEIIGTTNSGSDEDTINASYASQSMMGSSQPFNYTVRTGDTLQSIAKMMWGDASLWYQIADANGLPGNDSLTPGALLLIPGNSKTSHNNANTLKPYSQSEALGDLTPTFVAPAGQDDGGCGSFGQLVMVVVAVAVTLYTAGAMGSTAGALFPTMEAGAGFMAGNIGIAAVAGAAGSIASQVVGMAMGNVKEFNWGGVATSALSAGITAGLGDAGIFETLISNPTGQLVARSMAANALTQSVAIQAGWQQTPFSWKGVAAAGAGSYVGSQITSFLGEHNLLATGNTYLTNVARGTVSGFAAGVTTAVLRGGSVSATQIATDAFGNALGSSLAEANSGELSPSELRNLDYDDPKMVAYRAQNPITRSAFQRNPMAALTPEDLAPLNFTSPQELLDGLPDIRIASGVPSAWNASPQNAMNPEEYAARRANIERNVQREILGQEARDASLGGQVFLTGGARGGTRSGRGGSFEMVRNNNWDNAFNIGSDPLQILGDVPDIMNELNGVGRRMAEKRVDEMRNMMKQAGVKNVPDYELNIGGPNGNVTRDYGRTLDKMGEVYENHLRDQRLRETWGDDYQNLRLGKSKMTVLELESKVLTLQQRSVDDAYQRGLDLMTQGKLKYSDGEYAKVLGNFIDKEVRTEMRFFAKSEGISDSATSNIWAINRRLKSDDVPYYGIPDGRLGLNIFHDTTLARKDGYTEQIQKWKSLREVSNFAIIRPTSLGGSYVIPRASVLPYKSPVQNIGRKF